IEDVPGVGKTLLARALAKSINCAFRRIQFTPDLLPSDILGVSIFDGKENRFEFKPGPIFANVVLADEINRTTPRTQSSLLEAMNDFQVSVDGVTRKLHLPFIVMATQNPFEFEGTYPLLESQLDRFLMKVSIGYPGVRDEKQILASQRTANPIDELQPALTVDEVLELQAVTKQVRVDESLVDYLLAIIAETRRSNHLKVGASPRASLFLLRAAQARARVEGRDYCIPDDIKRLVAPVLAHRLIPKGRRSAGTDATVLAALQEITDAVPVPV
ncbi:MAG: MoxR family ATPase, partial [Planctomycetes bacterium]|nr:MoxR family ATPase [Planctomycetota bacterium]